MRPFRRITRILLLAPLAAPLGALASPASDALLGMAQNDWAQRSLSLADLGISEPLVLDQSDSRQAFFLPVPRGVSLSDARIEVQGDFIRGEEVPASLKMTVDGRPLVAQRITDRNGDLGRSLPVEAHGHGDGFVTFAIDWSSATGQRLCEPVRQTTNVLTLSPQTRLTYRYSISQLDSLADAWSTLPGKPVLLVAAGRLDAASFDSAWRIGVTLERAGKHSRIQALPAVGDSVELGGVQVPSALTGISAFAALDGKARHTLASPAELGALLMLDTPALRADLAIADSALVSQVNTALDALKTELGNDADALRAFEQWRARHASLASEPPASQQLKLASLSNQALIAVAGDAGAKASAALDIQWRNVLVSRQATVHNAGGSLYDGQGNLRLSALGGNYTQFDVVSRGEWVANFPLGAVANDGRMPAELNLDVAAAPGASATRPVASIMLNGVLLSAKRLEADGGPERLNAQIPGYALAVNNSLQVRFQRQPVSPDCAEVPQGYPVNVLPSSYLRPAKAEPDGTFVGLLPLLAGHAQVIVPNTSLDAPLPSLRKLVRLAAAASVSPVNAELTLADGKAAFSPSKPFLSIDVPLQGAKPLLDVQDAQRLRAQNGATPAIDLQGPQPLSAISVVDSASQHGVLWYSLGDPAMAPSEAFLLNRGNAVVLGEQGPLAWVDSTDPDMTLNATPFHQWRQYLVWALPTLAGVILVLLLLGVLARRARLNKYKDK